MPKCDIRDVANFNAGSTSIEARDGVVDNEKVHILEPFHYIFINYK